MLDLGSSEVTLRVKHHYALPAGMDVATASMVIHYKVILERNLRCRELDGAMVSAPLLVDGILYVPTMADTIHAIRTSDQKTMWQFTTEDEAWGTPVLYEEKLFVADLKGNISALDINTGKPVWSVSAGGAVVGSGGLTPDGVVFVTEEGDVLLVSFDGVKQWTRSIDGKLYGVPAIGDDCIVVSVVGGEQLLVAYDFRGNEIWTFAPPK